MDIEKKHIVSVWDSIRSDWKELSRDKYVTRPNISPKDFVLSLYRKYDKDTVIEVFKNVAEIKSHDGRISKSSREFLGCIYYDRVNTHPMYDHLCGLDDIHAANIDNTIEAMILLDKKGKE